MEKEKFDEWFEKLGKAWCDLDPEEAISLFSKDVEYYESVFEKPCSSWKEVLNLWKVIPENQKNVSFEHEIICIKDDLAVVNWKVTRTLIPSNKVQDINGIFIIKLNDEGLCNYFKQWRAVREY